MSLSQVSAATSTSTDPTVILQQTVYRKMVQTSVQIAQQALVNITADNSLSYAAFVEKNITPNQAELSQLDSRTHKFFVRMVNNANKKLKECEQAQPPAQRGLFDLFDRRAKEGNDPTFRRKFMESTALPHVKTLVNDFDQIKPTIIDQINAVPSWEAHRSRAKIDLIIKGIAIVVFSAITVTATTLATLTSVLPIAVVGGFPLGNLIAGLVGCIGAYLIKRGMREGNLFGHLQSFFDLHQYFKPEVAQQVCQDLRKDSFRDLLNAYDMNSLYKYGFIDAIACDEIQLLAKEVKQVDQERQEWQLDHLQQVKLYKDDPENPEAALVREQKVIFEAKEAALEAKWQSILNEFVLPLLPEEEIAKAHPPVSAQAVPVPAT